MTTEPVINTNDVPLASGQGILDVIVSQGTGLGVAALDELWILVILVILAVVGYVLYVHFVK